MTAKKTHISPHESEESRRLYNLHNRWLILAALVASAFLEIMDTSIVNVALPQMAGTLGATVTDAAWVSTAYILANVIVLPMTAWLAQRFGRKSYLVASIIIFSIARLCCGFAPSLGIVILCRIVQGAAGAALISTAQAVLVEIFPSHQQGLAQGVFGIGLVVAPAVSPMLGGWIVDNYSWQTVYFIHLPVTAIALYLIATLFHDGSTDETKAIAGKLNIIGVALLSIGLGSLQYVLEEGQRYDWLNDTWIARFTAMAVVGIIAMLAWELSPKNKNPVVDFRVYLDRGLASAVLLSFAIGIGMYAVNFAYTILVQDLLGFTATKAGLAVCPMGFGALFGIMIVSALVEKIDPRPLVFIGIAICALSSYELGFNTSITGIEHTWFPMTMMGFGTGMAMISTNIVAFFGLKESQFGSGAAQLGLGRQLGGSFGIAIIDTYISQMTDLHRSNLVSHLYSANQSFTQTVYGLSHMLAHPGVMAQDALRAGMSLIDQDVTLQSMIMGYNSGFQEVSILFMCTLPFVLLLKGKQKTQTVVKVSAH
jgi:DHA2 family multidrug resistance protein